MDWFDQYMHQASQMPIARELKEKKFFGTVEINYADGVPTYYEFKTKKKEVKREVK